MPMLLQRADKMFALPDWVYGSVRLISRNGHSFTTSSGRARMRYAVHNLVQPPGGPYSTETYFIVKNGMT